MKPTLTRVGAYVQRLTGTGVNNEDRHMRGRRSRQTGKTLIERLPRVWRFPPRVVGNLSRWFRRLPPGRRI
jgi:hypothetical protein